jgi:hypothetical protein
MKILFAFFSSFIFILIASAQSGISLVSGTSMVINTGTTFSVDGLVLEPSSAFTISGSNRIVRNSTLSHSSLNTAILRSFKWNANLNSFSGNITIFYNDTELNGLDESGLTLNIHDGNIWQAFNTGVMRNVSSNFVSTAGLANRNLNELTLAAITAPLPLHWGPVEAYRIGKLITVKWQTFNEEAVKSFVVERSLDGLQWFSVGHGVAALSNAGPNHYTQTDSLPTIAAVFYRIKQEDENGQISYSRVVKVAALREKMLVEIYPNPVINALNVTVQSNSTHIKTMVLYNAGGNMVLHEKHVAKPGRIDMSKIPAGIYLLQITLSDGTVITEPIQKQ